MKHKTQSLSEFVLWLTSPTPVPLSGDDNHMYMPTKPGFVVEINRKTFEYFREAVPSDSPDSCMLCYAESLPLPALVFRRGHRFFARLLTDEETRLFCELAEIPLPGQG